MMLLALLMFYFAPAEARSPSTIQLTSSVATSFGEWRLLLDTGVLFSFDETGQLSLTVPEDSAEFEVVDPNREVRFSGSWTQFENPSLITINIGGIVETQVVSASRIRQSSWQVPSEISVIRPDANQDKSTVQTSDWLKEQSEILLQKTNLGGGAAIMRGMSGNRVLLMIDGFRLNNATYRLGLNQYLNTVPGSGLDQIEVLSGPSGVQYGSDGLGGTIHLRTVDPSAEDGSDIQYKGFASTADGTNTHQVSGYTSKGKVSVRGHYQYNHYEDLKAGGSVGKQSPTGYNSWDSSLNMTYTIDEERRIRFVNNYSDANHVPRTDRILSGRDLLWEYDPQILRMHGVRYESRKPGGFTDFMDIGLGYFRQDEGTRRISAGSPELLEEDMSMVDTYQLNGTFTKISSRVQWVYGFDGQQDGIQSSASQTFLDQGSVRSVDPRFPNDSDYRSLGIFGVAEIDLGRRQHLKAGLRQTWAAMEGTLAAPIGPVDETYEQLTPSLSWFTSRDRLFLSFGVSQGFRAPSLEDTLTLGPTNRGFDAPNPNLQPENMWSYETNLRWRGDRSLYQASVYASRYKSLIERVPGEYQGSDTFGGEPVFILDNVGKASVDGISLQYAFRLNEAHAFNTDASWTEGTQTDRDEPMSRIPPLRGNLSWAYRSGKMGVTGLFSWAARQDRLSPGDIDDSRIPVDGTPGYGVVHLRGYYKITEQVGFKLGLENLGDKRYKSHGSGIFEPGRRAVIELNASWK